MSRSSAYGLLDSAKYFCTLTLLEYDRPKPFDPVSYKVQKVIRLPLPQELNDSTQVAFNNIDLKVVGDIANKDAVGIGAEGLRQAGTVLKSGIDAAATGLQAVGAASGSLAGGLQVESVVKLFPMHLMRKLLDPLFNKLWALLLTLTHL